MDRAYQSDFNEFEDVEFSQHKQPVQQQMNFQNRQSLLQNRYARYNLDEANEYYDQFGYDEYNDFVPLQQQFTQRSQNRVNLGQQRYTDVQQNSYGRSSEISNQNHQQGNQRSYQQNSDHGRSSDPAEDLNNEMMELLKQIKQEYQGDQDNYESNWQTQENRQTGQHELDDNSINKKFDTIMEFLKDIQKSNEVRDREVKALSQQVGQLAEEVAIIIKNQDKLLIDCQKNTSHKSSHTNVHIDESIVEEKECFMIDGLVEVKKKTKKSRRSRRKKGKKSQKMDGEEGKCEFNSWLLNKMDGVSKLWMNRLMKMRDCKHPTRPP